ncbi:MAG: mannose-1-phosphate guanylyltransferase [Syntrophobacterales bacterium]|nr:MAG: mannose-1-phosphate guanylyltransferase [Syntrophobacterales bacterium]
MQGLIDNLWIRKMGKREMKANHSVFVIMGGGSGTRFWPLSRELKPKQFLNILGQRPLIEETFLRISPLADEERVFLVINRAHRELTRKIFKDRGIQIFEEPFGRNTAPCVGLAAIHIKRRWGDIPMAVLPADHFIGDGELFRTTLRAGIELSRRGKMVTIGIPPIKPETGYGYIKRGRRCDSIRGQGVFEVDRFVEKPDEKRALLYIKEGNYLWNSGIFIFQVDLILNEIGKYLPKLYQGLMEIEGVLDRDQYPATLERIYSHLQSISIDYGIMERTREPVYTLLGNFGWSDVGSWQALFELKGDQRNANGNMLEGLTTIIDSRDSFIVNRSEKLVAVLGANQLLVVNTPDAVLVGDLNRSQEVRAIAEAIKRKGFMDWV